MSTVLLQGVDQMIPANSPRQSQHQLIRYKNCRHLYIPERILQRMWRPLEGIGLLNYFAPNHELVHSFNLIPLTNKPWIVSFESILPRTIGNCGDQLSLLIRNRLAQDNCRQIIALSNYAKQTFLMMNQGWSEREEIRKKLTVIHPSFPIKSTTIKTYTTNQPLELIFIGNDFARKGGIVALRVAKKAKQLNLPVKFNLISNLNYGAHVYTDTDKHKYQPDLELLNLDNITHYQNLPNQEVIKLLAQSHFQMMCTLDDTYGYSILEGFSVATPAITTNVCALPEFVNSNNGHLVNLELNEYGNWIYLGNRLAGIRPQKQPVIPDEDYWSVLDTTYEYMANQVIEFIIKILENPDKYEQLSAGAVNRAKVQDAAKTNDFFDQLYQAIINSQLPITN